MDVQAATMHSRGKIAREQNIIGTRLGSGRLGGEKCRSQRNSSLLPRFLAPANHTRLGFRIREVISESENRSKDAVEREITRVQEGVHLSYDVTSRAGLAASPDGPLFPCYYFRT